MIPSLAVFSHLENLSAHHKFEFHCSQALRRELEQILYIYIYIFHCIIPKLYSLLFWILEINKRQCRWKRQSPPRTAQLCCALTWADFFALLHWQFDGNIPEHARQELPSSAGLVNEVPWLINTSFFSWLSDKSSEGGEISLCQSVAFLFHSGWEKLPD